MMPNPAVEIQNLTHRYGERVAVDTLTLDVAPGEIVAMLGPNGSGKTTLFRILSTLIAPVEGSVRLLAMDVVRERDAVRRQIGVVFQSPGLDKQLTARENLMHHGHLYGLRGEELRTRIARMLDAVGLAARANERVAGFSGGMRRRVELAKGLLTEPRLLILDEPSTGLDPAARIELWSQLKRVQAMGTTVVLTTHLMDEADRATRVAIMREGKLLAYDTPDALKARIGGDVLTFSTAEPEAAVALLIDRLGILPTLIDGKVRFEAADGHAWVPRVVEALPGQVQSISMGRPTLEDVFIRLTGARFDGDADVVHSSSPKGSKAPV